MVKYRPEGWPIVEFGVGNDNMAYRDAFEAGADAILEGLRKTGEYGYKIDYIFNVDDEEGKGNVGIWGKRVFIPEEVK